MHVVSDSDPDPNSDWWIKGLHLYASDKQVLEQDAELTDAIVNAAQSLLSTQFPHISGFQSTLLGINLHFKSFARGVQSLQILNTG